MGFVVEAVVAILVVIIKYWAQFGIVDDDNDDDVDDDSVGGLERDQNHFINLAECSNLESFIHQI